MKPFTLLLFGMSASAALAQLPLTGGQTTTKQAGTAAFSQPAANLSLMDRVDFSVGNAFFRNPWVIAPSSTTARDGLGPVFNTNGCQNCHIRDGRGHAPIDSEDDAMSMLIRLSVTPSTQEESTLQRRYGPLPDPVYGGQLQDLAVPGIDPEGRIRVRWQKHPVTYPDGRTVVLRKPDFEITELAYGDFHAQVAFSPRIAPQMIGLGLLEQIPEADILANADPDDANGDGISGRANRVWDQQKERSVLGRFGWKAGMPTLEQQNAAAFNGDIGITSVLFPLDDCTAKQIACRQAPNGDTAPEKELQSDVLEAVTFYTRHLAVPIQRNPNDNTVTSGQQLFNDIGCNSCHTPTFTTPALPGLPALSEQTFHPFTDLLLHDMGDGLADHRAEFLANGREWRTPPLWGLGYLTEVNDQIALLHDGRAQSLEEAILWHGGEATDSRDAFMHLAPDHRESILDFLNSL